MKKYDKEFVKELTGYFKNIFRKAVNFESDINAAKNSIKSSFNYLKFNKFFLEQADYEVQGTEYPNSLDHYHNFLKSIYVYLERKHLREKYLGQLPSNVNEIKQIIKDVSNAQSPLKRLFASKKAKEETNSKIESLIAIKESDAFSDAEATFREYDDLPNVDIKIVKEFFDKNKSLCFDTVLEADSSAFESEPLVPITKKLTDQYNLIEERLSKCRDNKENFDSQIRNIVDRILVDQLYDLLKEIPVDELAREKKGLRIKPLKEAGIISLKDVFVRSPYHLASIKGISLDVAYSVKSITDTYATKAKQTLKLKISADNKTKNVTDLISKVFQIKLAVKSLEEAEKANSENIEFINHDLSYLTELGNGESWNFMEKHDQDVMIESCNNLNKQLFGDYSETVFKAFQLSESEGFVSSTDAWNDFVKDPISFINIIEAACPGAFGNSDRVYGLPDDLAKEIEDECIFPNGLKCELRNYQVWGVKYILHQGRVLLGDEMGLGKTVQAIATMVSLKNVGMTHFVVVCPASVVTNWCREIIKHSQLQVIKVHGNGRKNALRAWRKLGGVAVTTYETTGIFCEMEDIHVDQLVVDEAHYVKNPGATRSKRVRKLVEISERVLFMTGTALENRVDEMIELISMLNLNIATKLGSVAFMSTADAFRNTVAPVYYRRKREDVLTELPDLIESEEWCTLSEKEEWFYEKAVFSKNFMEIRRVSWNVDDLRDSSKAKRLLEIVEDAKNDNRKVLVFSFFLDTIKKIYELLGNRICVNPINGSLTPARRQEIIDEFDAAPPGAVLCAQIQSGGTGLNIQSASVVVLCEPQFKPSIENQAISRAYRMGQARNVQVFRLLCEDTIDERMSDLLQQKQEIFDTFADKSVAAENTVEIDTKSFTDLINEEIERIKEKNGGVEKDYSKTPIFDEKDNDSDDETISTSRFTSRGSAKSSKKEEFDDSIFDYSHYPTEENDYDEVADAGCGFSDDNSIDDLIKRIEEGFNKENNRRVEQEQPVVKQEAPVGKPIKKQSVPAGEETSKELGMSYEELVEYLKEKYGPVKGDYFLNETCRSKNASISRGDEGLFIHHIDEDKAIKLSEPDFAFRNPFAYQKADRLVYCNILEHLILHLRIAESNTLGDNSVPKGIGGAVEFICRQINDCFSGKTFTNKLMIKVQSQIKDKFWDYIAILEEYVKLLESTPEYNMFYSKRSLCLAFDGSVVKKVFDALK